MSRIIKCITIELSTGYEDHKEFEYKGIRFEKLRDLNHYLRTKEGIFLKDGHLRNIVTNPNLPICKGVCEEYDIHIEYSSERKTSDLRKRKYLSESIEDTKSDISIYFKEYKKRIKKDTNYRDYTITVNNEVCNTRVLSEAVEFLNSHGVMITFGQFKNIIGKKMISKPIMERYPDISFSYDTVDYSRP